ncbi:MAG: hypothetical protein B6244_01375 [Candidatus Cloacimonetes bacterium 4572_55]|nr:MAG: hypothetical protein B6244_01375 [Candidatus Cloacimonetes bacterium 4572_55]
MRKSWDEYFLEILHAAQKRATCDRGKAAAVIVKENHILATGYVGSPSGIIHCDEIGHEFIESYEKSHDMNEIVLKQHCIRTVHAEQNAICQAARFGIPIDKATIYCTMFPCYTCAKMLINVGIVEVIAEFDYQSSQLSKQIFNKIGVSYRIISPRKMNYS